MKLPSLHLTFTLLFSAALPLTAQVPQILNYQGKIAVSGAPFTGTGQFRFALVSADGSTSYWSNDGTSTAGSEPTAAVSLPVVNGLYLAPLGDTAISGMSAMPASVFANSGVHLRVWFNDGVNGSAHLAPDQRLAAVAYAMMADTVPDGAITSAKLAPGAVGAAQLAPGALTGALGSAGLSGVASGGVVLSTTEDNTALTDAGFVAIGNTILPVEWRRVDSPMPALVYGLWTGTEMIFWGGYDENQGILNEGMRYNPTTKVWTPISTEGAPLFQDEHHTLWTGTEMIVWGNPSYDDGQGGYTESSFGGARYNPNTDTWTPISEVDAPEPRYGYQVVWTGTEMILWGGANTEHDYVSDPSYVISTTIDRADGARYNPATDHWTPISEIDAPTARRDFRAVWTGTEMIVLGGYSGGVRVRESWAPPFWGWWQDYPSEQVDMWRYNPSTDAWVQASLLDVGYLANNSSSKTILWTGSELFVGVGTIAESGFYDPLTDSWRLISPVGAPGERYDYTTVWTGSEIIFWGGDDGNGMRNDGYFYHPTTNAWRPMLTQSPEGRSQHSAVWTGNAMFVWGGQTTGGSASSFEVFKPGSVMHLYVRP